MKPLKCSKSAGTFESDKESTDKETQPTRPLAVVIRQ